MYKDMKDIEKPATPTNATYSLCHKTRKSQTHQTHLWKRTCKTACQHHYQWKDDKPIVAPQTKVIWGIFIWKLHWIEEHKLVKFCHNGPTSHNWIMEFAEQSQVRKLNTSAKFDLEGKYQFALNDLWEAGDISGGMVGIHPWITGHTQQKSTKNSVQRTFLTLYEK